MSEINYKKEDFEEMDNQTLKTVAELLVNGRQYENIEKEKHNCLAVMKERL